MVRCRMNECKAAPHVRLPDLHLSMVAGLISMCECHYDFFAVGGAQQKQARLPLRRLLCTM